MPNVTKGANMRGLMSYLAGPGKANEHTDPHLVAGDSAIMAWFDDDQLSPSAALAVGRTLDHPRTAMDVSMPVHVWHCSLSLRAEEGQLGDQKWAAVAQDFVDGMGFTDTPGSPGEGKAPCRWVAVHHGASKAGNDHIHIVVSLVREDGTKASIGNDHWNAQKLTAQLERRHGLQVVESRGQQRGERGVKPGELQRAERTGAAEPARRLLERQVRAAATAAVDEAEFVRRLRADGVLVRARMAAGTDDVVVGFSVAVKPTPADRAAGQTPVWFGGGRLAQDLTLPRLRESWPDTPEAATAAAAEWVAAKRGRRAVAPDRELAAPTPEQWAQTTDAVRVLREHLRTVAPGDTDTWTRVSADTAGAFAAWSRRTEPTPGPLAATARVLGASAQVRRPARRPSGPSARGAALLLASIGHGGGGPVATAALLRQLANTTKAIHDAHIAAGDHRRAAEIEAVVRGQLEQVRRTLPEPPTSGPQAVVTAPTAPARPVGQSGQPCRQRPRGGGLDRSRPPHQVDQRAATTALVDDQHAAHHHLEEDRMTEDQDNAGDVVAGAVRVALTAAGQLAEQAARRRGADLREAERDSAARVATLQSQLAAERELALRSVHDVIDRGDATPVDDLARAWEQASIWDDADMVAARARLGDRIRDRFGIDASTLTADRARAELITAAAVVARDVEVEAHDDRHRDIVADGADAMRSAPAEAGVNDEAASARMLAAESHPLPAALAAHRPRLSPMAKPRGQRRRLTVEVQGPDR